MYLSHFKLDEPPFANIADPNFMFPSAEHKRAISTLQYALMARTGFCVITGDIGAGKTTLVRHVLQNIPSRLYVGLVSNTQCEDFEELLRWILLAFELDYKNKDKVEMYDDFVQFLIQKHAADEPVTLIIDEAQNLSLENLEQLRMLSNVNSEKGQLLQTILVGQPELWTLLHDPALVQFAQRISQDYFLKPLPDAATVGDYIEYRLEHAGGDPNLFAENTYALIWEVTGGVPRLINLICDTALVFAYGEDETTITKKLIQQVIEHKRSSFPVLQPKRLSNTDTPTRARDSDGSVRSEKKKRLSVIERAAQQLNNNS